MGEAPAQISPHGSALAVNPVVPGPKALLVTTDIPLGRACRAAALAAGLGVEETQSAVSALNLARTRQFDLILLDVELRDVHGLELVAWLRSDALLRRLPVIAFSAFAGNRHDARMATGNVLALLSKPVQPVHLSHWVKQAL